MKDTHLLQKKDFSLKNYSEYFQNNKKPIIEVDQNMAIHEQAFININKYFTNPTIIYIVRNSKMRFYSAYKWLLKMGLVSNMEDALKNYRKFMIDHGLYKENIKNNILPHCNSKLVIIKFEDLIKEDGITFANLKKILQIPINNEDLKPMVSHNKSTKPRFKTVTKFLKYLYKDAKYFLPSKINVFIKTSPLVQKILFSDDKKQLSKVDMETFNNYKHYFKESDQFIESINFNNGICEMFTSND